MTDKVLKMYDADGNFTGVFVPAALWEQMQENLPKKTAVPEASDDLEGFNELLASWTFAYPYDPAVSCPACGSATSDWRSDPDRPFRLASANFGGLLVFHCKNCGATIRHKYFRRHMSRECSS